MKILLVGDSHGDLSYIEMCLDRAKAFGCEKLFQLGDFGYFEHFAGGPGYLNGVSLGSVESGIPVYFLDGNHENHPLLWETYQEEDDEGFRKVRENLHYAPRGHSWIWDGIRFLSVGGAWSIDQAQRTPGKSWWPEENIRHEDVNNAIASGDCDVLLSHDVLAGVTVPGIMPIQAAMWNRDCLLKVAIKTHPKYVFHGHYHIYYTEHYQHGGVDANVVGLAHNCLPNGHPKQPYELWDATYVLDTQQIRRELNV